MSKPDIVVQLCNLHADLLSELQERSGVHTFRADEISSMASLVLDAATVADKYARITEGHTGAKYKRGDRLRKTKGSEWQGRVVGFYSTEQTPIGYCIESEFHRGSVQIYPENALEAVPKAEHSDKLRHNLENVAGSLQSRPPELRGPFESSATAPKPGSDLRRTLFSAFAAGHWNQNQDIHAAFDAWLKQRGDGK